MRYNALLIVIIVLSLISTSISDLIISHSSVLVKMTFIEEGGLKNWCLIVNSSQKFLINSSAFTISLPVGVYNFTAVAANYLSNLSSYIISLNKNCTIIIILFVPAFHLIFNETGLGKGYCWCVCINGSLYKARNQSSLNLYLPQGIYYYYIITHSFYVPNPTNGVINLSKNSLITINFTWAYFKLKITMENYINNSIWYLYLNSTRYIVNSSTFCITLPALTVVYISACSKCYSITPSLESVRMISPVCVFLTMNKKLCANSIMNSSTQSYTHKLSSTSNIYLLYLLPPAVIIIIFLNLRKRRG
jgi:hypothetical protein